METGRTTQNWVPRGGKKKGEGGKTAKGNLLRQRPTHACSINYPNKEETLNWGGMQKGRGGSGNRKQKTGKRSLFWRSSGGLDFGGRQSVGKRRGPGNSQEGGPIQTKKNPNEVSGGHKEKTNVGIKGLRFQGMGLSVDWCKNTKGRRVKQGLGLVLWGCFCGKIQVNKKSPQMRKRVQIEGNGLAGGPRGEQAIKCLGRHGPG